jgi:hypothetical protein
MRRCVFILVFVAVASAAMAQRGFAAPHFAFNRGYGAASAFWRGGSFAYPFLAADGYYSGAGYAGYSVASPVVILQAPPAAGTMVETRPGEPVLIELRGDSYVRISGPAASGTMLEQASRGQASTPTPQMHSVQSSTITSRSALQQSVPQQPAPQPKSVTLVFRDGHREDVSDYVIANGNLYAHTSYYTAGAWTKSIDLAALDVPGTINDNQSRGVPFQLPNAANEVIVGP